jgi:hypothetical protein
MNPVIKSQTRSFQVEHGLTELSPSEAFEAYTIYAVLAGQLSYPVNAIDAHLKGDEFGLDGVAILIEGRLAQDTDDAVAHLTDVFDPDIEFIFFQSKTGSSYEYGEIGKFFDGIEQFINGELSGESEQLDDLIAVKDLIYEQAVSKRNPGIRIYYATTGNYDQPDKIENLLERRMRTLRSLSIFDTNRMHLEMLGAERLQSYYRSAKRSSKAKIEFPRQTALPKNSKVEQGYVGYIAASEIVKMVQVTNDAGDIIGINRYIFFDNVRDYNEKSPLNQKISSTLNTDEGPDFVFRNNGVTVIAKSIHRTADEFTIEDFQIVNGCQTTNIIFQNRQKIEDVFIPFRLIGTNDDEFISSIIVGTNSQNQIKSEQFIALLPFVKNLEEYSRSTEESVRLFIERRESQYQHETIERSRIISLPVLMKAVSATILGQPNRSARDYKKLFKDNEKNLFTEHSDVQIYHAVAYLYYKLEFLWRNNRIDPSLKIYRFYILWAAFREATDNSDLLRPMNTNKSASFAEKIIDFAKEEDGFKAAIERYGKGFEKVVAAFSSENREKLRDSIRSDTAFLKISEELFPPPAPPAGGRVD